MKRIKQFIPFFIALIFLIGAYYYFSNNEDFLGSSGNKTNYVKLFGNNIFTGENTFQGTTTLGNTYLSNGNSLLEIESTSSSVLSGELLFKDDLINISNTTTYATLSQYFPNSGSGYDWDNISNCYIAIPIITKTNFTSLSSFLGANINTVSVGGVWNYELYEENNYDLSSSTVWNSYTLNGTLIASGTQTISTTGVKTFTFSSNPILNLSTKGYYIKLTVNGSYSNTSFFNGAAYSYGTNEYNYKGTCSSVGGSVFGANTFDITMISKLQGYAYKSNNNYVDGICNSNKIIGQNIELKKSGIYEKQGIETGKLYFSNTSGQFTTEQTGSNYSIGLAVENDKLLIIRGLK